VYDAPVTRTNIDIDDEVVGRVMNRYHLRSKKEAVDFALRRADREALTKEEALAMQGTGGWDGDLDALRAGSRPVES
jgi:Arc/MetJ family transcription regulator